ncbi:MAG: ABC transporter substrate-binding protein [Chloroflexota bacterium]
MTPGFKRGTVVMASLAVATLAIGPVAVAQSPSPAASAAPAASGAPASTTPDLFNSDYKDRVKKGKAGGTIIIADWQEANLFNPYYTNNVTEADIATATTRGLVGVDDKGKYFADVATSIPTLDNGGVTVGQNGDGQTVTWTLRDDAKWSDGTAITCDDYAYTLEWYTDDTNSGIPAGLSGYLTDDFLARRAAAALDPEAAPVVKTDADINFTLECTSPTEMVWHLKNPYEGYLGLLPYVFQRAYNSQFPVADMVNGAGWSADVVGNAVVAGPYKFESVTPGQQVDLVRNDYYVSPITGEKPYADKIIAKWYGSADAMIAAYQGAEPEYDFAKDLSDADIAKVQGLKNVVIQPSLTYEFLRPNWDAEHCSLLLQPVRNGVCPFSQEAWRKALSYVIDRDTINSRILGGQSVMAYTNTSPNAWYYVAPAEKAVQDLDKAAAALDEGGWIVNPDDPAGRRFWDQNGNGKKDEGEPDARIEACTTTRQYRQDMLALLSGWFNQIGVQVTISPVSSVDVFAAWNESTPTTACALDRGNFDLALHAFSVPVDPVSNFPVYHSTQTPPNGQNSAHVNNADLDAALTQLKNTVDFSVVQDSMNTFQKVYIDSAVETPVFYWAQTYLVNPKLQNYTGNPSSVGPLWNIQDWFLKKGGKKG